MFFRPFLILTTVTVVGQINITAVAANPRSDCSTAATALKLNPSVCDGVFDAKYKTALSRNADDVTLRKLGITLRQLGYLDEAQTALERSQALNPSLDTALSLANLTHAKYRLLVGSVDWNGNSEVSLEASQNALKLAQKALDEYALINKAEPNRVQAPLNWFNFWSRLSSTPELKQLQTQNLQMAKGLLNNLLTKVDKLPDDYKTEVRLKVVEGLLRVSALDKSFLPLAMDNAQKSISESENLRHLSLSHGLVGQIQARQGHVDAALVELGKARSGAESIRAYDLLYQWQWGLGKLYAKTGQREKAEAMYTQAIASIEKVRSEMLSLKSDVQYTFRDDIEPVYREYLNFMFAAQTPDLKQIISVNEKLQIGELENYLQCGNLGLTSLLSLTPEQSPDATLYFVRLPQKYGILVRDKGGSIHSRLVERAPIDALLTSVKYYLQGDRAQEGLGSTEFRAISNRLYQQLLMPITEYLPKSGHLTIAVDSNLQGVPWALLYDGQQYLPERFSTSLTLGSELMAPQPLQEKIRGVVAGTTEFPNNPGFADLPSVNNEVQEIATVLKAKTLLNSEFTDDNLLRLGGNASILHLATHGQFTSNPQDTFILNWDGKLTFKNLEKLIRGRRTNPLELLVLSACETAKGDRRATLGLAGAALQSGARSTIASLWAVQDASQSILMHEFYKQLLQNRKSKAEALRLAQIKFLKSSEYANPYFWAGLVLLGSWQ